MESYEENLDQGCYPHPILDEESCLFPHFLHQDDVKGSTNDYRSSAMGITTTLQPPEVKYITTVIIEF